MRHPSTDPYLFAEGFLDVVPQRFNDRHSNLTYRYQENAHAVIPTISSPLSNVSLLSFSQN
jgi:hypothetical protein